VQGDLCKPDTYHHALTNIDTVLHLAAATGGATRHEHFRVNARGTDTLVQSCIKQGVARICFVSTIAVTFRDIRRYPYAQSKQQAEETVRSSGLDHVIVRPTMILGNGAPVFAGLRRLAALPLVPVFGRGHARVQPIHVHDVVTGLTTILRESLFNGQTVELGGPETLTIKQLLGRIHEAIRGRPAHFAHIPYSLLTTPLWWLERIGVNRLPLTAGQLSSFRFDGTASPQEIVRDQSLLSIASMIEAGLAS